jgi:hypothetical protein
VKRDIDARARRMDSLISAISSLAILVLGNILFFYGSKSFQDKENAAIASIAGELRAIDGAGHEAFLMDWRKVDIRRRCVWANVAMAAVMLFLLPFAYRDPEFVFWCAGTLCLGPLLFIFIRGAHRIIIVKPAGLESRRVSGKKSIFLTWEEVSTIRLQSSDVGSYLAIEGNGPIVNVPEDYSNFDRFKDLLSAKYPWSMQDLMGTGIAIVRDQKSVEPAIKTSMYSILGLVMVLAGIFIPSLIGVALGNGEKNVPLLGIAVCCLAFGGFLLAFLAGSVDQGQRNGKLSEKQARRELVELKVFTIILYLALSLIVILELMGVFV